MSVPVVCVGNFVAGGAGKTPAAIAIARLLLERGESPAFLSRGYGGVEAKKTVAVNPNVHSADEVGDEPLLLARVAPCFVARDRRAAAAQAVAAGATVLVLDDGLQSPSIVKDVAFAMIDGAVGVGNGLCLPAGPLRAPLKLQLPYVASTIFVDDVSDAGIAAREAVAAKPILNARLEPDATVAAQLRNQNVLAFAGIGRPAKFFATLEGLGARVAIARGFADHQRYSPTTLDALFSEAASRGLTLVTTQKDFVRLPPSYAGKVTALPVSMQFEEPGEVAALLAEALARRRAAP
jgi:tetraacyldisaccharide 4'-kinase